MGAGASAVLETVVGEPPFGVVEAGLMPPEMEGQRVKEEEGADEEELGGARGALNDGWKLEDDGRELEDGLKLDEGGLLDDGLVEEDSFVDDGLFNDGFVDDGFAEVRFVEVGFVDEGLLVVRGVVFGAAAQLVSFILTHALYIHLAVVVFFKVVLVVAARESKYPSRP